LKVRGGAMSPTVCTQRSEADLVPPPRQVSFLRLAGKPYKRAFRAKGRISCERALPAKGRQSRPAGFQRAGKTMHQQGLWYPAGKLRLPFAGGARSYKNTAHKKARRGFPSAGFLLWPGSGATLSRGWPGEWLCRIGCDHAAAAYSRGNARKRWRRDQQPAFPRLPGRFPRSD